jgi:hypothetical protein
MGNATMAELADPVAVPPGLLAVQVSNTVPELPPTK